MRMLASGEGCICHLALAFPPLDTPPGLYLKTLRMFQILRQRRIDRGALTLASPEVKFKLDTDTQDPMDVGMYQVR